MLCAQSRFDLATHTIGPDRIIAELTKASSLRSGFEVPDQMSAEVRFQHQVSARHVAITEVRSHLELPQRRLHAGNGDAVGIGICVALVFEIGERCFG